MPSLSEEEVPWGMSPSCQIRHTPLVSLLSLSFLDPCFRSILTLESCSIRKNLGGVRNEFLLTVCLRNF